MIAISALGNGCIKYGEGMWAYGNLSLLSCITLFRIIPFLGVYIVMIEMISTSFLKFCVIFALFLMTFAVWFHLTFPNEGGIFLKGDQAFITTWVMMIGEMQYLELIEGVSKTVNISVVHVVFVVFLVCLCLIVMNLLTGVDVNDVDKLRKESIYFILKMQIQCLSRKTTRTHIAWCGEILHQTIKLYNRFRAKRALALIDPSFIKYESMPSKVESQNHERLMSCDFHGTLPHSLQRYVEVIPDRSISKV